MIEFTHRSDDWEDVHELFKWMEDNDARPDSAFMDEITKWVYAEERMLDTVIAARRGGYFDPIDCGGISWSIRVICPNQEVATAYRLRYD